MLSLSPVTFKQGDAASFVAVYFPNAKQEPNGNWLVSCPNRTHGKGRGDRNPSLSIKQGEKGIVFHDFTGCTCKTICDALGVREADLFKPEDKPHTNGNSKGKRIPVRRTEYVYRDEQGRPLYKKVRVDYDDGSKSYPQDRWENGRWESTLLEDTRRVLYHLPEVIKADPGDPVYIPEGEKCVEDLERRGLVSTTSGGVDSWRPEFAPFLAGRVCIVLSDNDAPGRKHAEAVARSLRTVASRVVVVHLPGLAEKQDVYDWMRMGNTIDDLEALVIAKLDETPGDVVASPITELSNDSHSQSENKPPRFQIIHEDELDALPPVSWLIKDEVAARQFNLLWGPSGGGKSFVAYDWAAQVGQEQTVIYVAAEDAQGYAARKIAWRKYHKTTASHVHFVPEGVNLFDHATVGDFIDLVRPMSPALIIFDTLARCMVGADENSNRDMGIVVENLEWIRRETGAAVLPVHHSGKNGQTYRGASALLGAAYASIELETDDDLITVVCDKAKNSPKFKPRKLRLVQLPTGRKTEDGEDETSCVVVPDASVSMQGADLTGRQRQILETLAMPIFIETGAKSSTLVEQHKDIKMPTLYRVLSELKQKGYIRQGAKGDPFYIEAEGLAAVSESIKRPKLSPTLTLVS